MTQQERAHKAIEILAAANKGISVLYADSPELLIRAKNTLTRLQNGFAHAAGVEMNFDHTGNGSVNKDTPKLTHVAGIAVNSPTTVNIAAAKPTKSDEEELEGYLDIAYTDFQTGEPAALLDRYNELVIRALAKRVGMPVTETQPATIDVTYVQNIKDVILKQVDDAKQKATPEPAATPASNKKEEKKTEEKKK